MPGPSVSVASTFTAEPLADPLRHLFELLGWTGQVRFALVGQVIPTLLDGSGLFARHRDPCRVVLVRGTDGIDVRELDHAIQIAVERDRSPVFVAVCPPHEERFAAALTCGQVVDLAAYEVTAALDERARELGDIPYTSEFFASLALAIARSAHREFAPPFKVIAVDCDDTLWTGVCGEDGPQGVVVDAPRHALQQRLLRQREAGRLLVLSSKNNVADVIETFAAHPEMPLRLDHFSARRIDWRPKAIGLQEIARELNLGLDSFILIDDSEKECAEVHAELPEVVTVALPASIAAEFLDHLWALDPSKALTPEDRDRAGMIAAEAERAGFQRQVRSLQDFLAELELEVEIAEAAQAEVARVAQLTMRTNQMNASTRRMSEAEVSAGAAEGRLFRVRVRDRFGDYGLVGAMMFGQAGSTLVVETFLLSCRAMGRGVEHRMLRFAGLQAQARGLNEVAVEFAPSPRNRPCEAFLRSVAVSGPPFVFAPGALSGLEFDPAKSVPEDVSERVNPVNEEQRRAADYSAIASLRSAADLDRAVRERRRRPRPLDFGPYTAARSETERRLTAIWSDLLGVLPIGLDDNFFDLGGHSLLAVQLVSRIERELGMRLPLEAVYTGTLTVRELVRSMESTGASDDVEYQALLEQVLAMSDEEAAALLDQEERRIP